MKKKCKYCVKPAKYKVIWADGRAYIPVCGSTHHMDRAIWMIEDNQSDKVTKVVKMR